MDQRFDRFKARVAPLSTDKSPRRRFFGSENHGILKGMHATNGEEISRSYGKSLELHLTEPSRTCSQRRSRVEILYSL